MGRKEALGMGRKVHSPEQLIGKLRGCEAEFVGPRHRRTGS